MNQDHVNMIMIILIVINMALLLYCVFRGSSEEFEDARKTLSKKVSVGVATANVAAQAAAQPKPAAVQPKPAASQPAAPIKPASRFKIPPQ